VKKLFFMFLMTSGCLATSYQFSYVEPNVQSVQAIPTPQAGVLALEQDNNNIFYYTGTQWIFFGTNGPLITLTPTPTATITSTPTITPTPNASYTATPTTTATIVLSFMAVNAQGTPVGTPIHLLMIQNEGIIGPWPPAFGYSRFGLFSKTNVALFGWSDVGQSELEMGNNSIDMTPGQGGNGFDLTNGVVDLQGSLAQQISALAYRRSISPGVAPYPVTLSSGAATIYDANLPAYTQGTPEPYCVPVSYVSTPPPYLPYVTIAEPAGTTLTVHGASTDNNIYQIKTDAYY